MNQTATTKIVDIRCQNIQWSVSNWGEFVIEIRNINLRMFSANSIAIAVMIALALVSGFMFAVDINNNSKR